MGVHYAYFSVVALRRSVLFELFSGSFKPLFFMLTVVFWITGSQEWHAPPRSLTAFDTQPEGASRLQGEGYGYLIIKVKNILWINSHFV